MELPQPAAERAFTDAWPRVRRVPLGAPLQWLALGWADFRRAPGIGLFFGAVFALMGWALVWAFAHVPAAVVGLSAGFLLVGPFVCIGLYQASRRLEQGSTPALWDCLTAWRSRLGAFALFGGGLLVLELVWARASLVVFALNFDGMPDFRGSILALLSADNATFLASYVAVGAVFASLIYVFAVVSMPMLLDREVDGISAALTSLRAVAGNPLPLALWAALLVATTVLGMLPGFAGLLVAAPVLGHASWHAYRACVAAPGLSNQPD
jgi:uncharacterized membrane protein